LPNRPLHLSSCYGVGDDIFVINQNYNEGDLDIITDFGFGDDKIRIDTQNGDEDTIAELLASGNNLRMEQTHDVPEGYSSHSDDTSALNTVIYDTKGTLTTADDSVLIILEDFSDDLTIAHFDIV